MTDLEVSLVRNIVCNELQAIIRSDSNLERSIRMQVIMDFLQQTPKLLQQYPKFHRELSHFIHGTRPSNFYQLHCNLILPRSTHYNLRQ